MAEAARAIGGVIHMISVIGVAPPSLLFLLTAAAALGGLAHQMKMVLLSRGVTFNYG